LTACRCSRQPIPALPLDPALSYGTGLAVLEVDFEELQLAQTGIQVTISGSALTFNQATYHHGYEVIRFTQSLASPFLNNHALRLLRSAVDLVSLAGGESTARREAARKFRAELGRMSDRAQYGLSCLDLLESAAEVETHRQYMNSFSVQDQPTAVSVYQNLQNRIHPNAESPQRKGFDWLTTRLGPDDAFLLMAPLTFLAFLADDPVNKFRSLAFEAAGREGMLRDASGDELLQWFGADNYVATYLAPVSRGEPIGTPFITDPLRAALELWTPSQLINAFCRPSTHLTTLPGDQRAYRHLVPPVIILRASSGNLSVLRNGLAEKDPNLVYDVLRHAGIMAAAERLAASVPDDAERVCWHRGCPVFATGLCWRWYMIPTREEGHDICRFPDEFAAVAKISPVDAWSRRTGGP
jgi:hypothetical protein